MCSRTKSANQKKKRTFKRRIMKTKATEFIYQDTKIHFTLSTDKNVMVNATEMAKAFNKRIDVFTKSDHAKKFIKALKNKLERTPNGGRSENEFTPKSGNSKTKVMDNRGHSGMYFDRRLALKFAAWLDVDFELWVYDTIDEIMFGEYRIHEAALQQTLKAEKEIEKLQVKLAENPDFQRIQALEKFIKTKDSEKRKALRDKKNQIEMNFKN